MLNIYFQVISLIYLSLIAIAFFTKKKLVSAENTIYKHLIVTDLAVILLDILSEVIGSYTTTSLLEQIVCKSYLLCLIGATLVFTTYALLVTRADYSPDEKLEKHSHISEFMIVLFTVLAAILVSIPIDIVYIDGTTYTAGPAVILTYLTCAITFALWILFAIVGRKNLTIKKAIPLIVGIVVSITASLIQFVIPECLLVTFANTFTISTMYFTMFRVANPDLELIEKIRDAKEEADRANKSKTEFLSNMSHEIRTPLNAILGFSQGLLEENISDSARDDIEDIVSSSDALLEIVNEILDISKYESNKLEIVNVEYTFDQVYKYLTTLAEERIGSSQLQFIHSCDPQIPQVLYGDYVRIRQIGVNLLTNAIKYTKEGFVRLKIDYKPIDKDTCKIIISVQDTGIGVKEENIDKIFSKYEIDDSKHKVIEGTGLGLALTKRLVSLMGGKIDVQSKRGEGSLFTVSFNQRIVHKTKEQIETENPMLKRKKFVGHGEKILIVDDNTVNLKVACRLLKYYNLDIDTCTSGKECIEKVSRQNYALVMLDDMMPDMNGPETLEMLRAQKTYKTPTIALTANAVSGMREKYLELGFNDYLAKPIDKLLLEDILINYLDNGVAEEVVEEPIREEVVQKQEPTNKTDILVKNGIVLESALEYLGDMEMYDETVVDFLSSIDQKLTDIAKYHYENNMPDYAVIAHSIKSDFKYLGAKDLADMAYKHEMAGKENNVEFVKENYDYFISNVKEMVEVLKEYSK